jgi:Tol biopolymer transport system component
MSLAAGTKLGPYEIQSPLGAGGMGEVYKARDTRLDRTVAIKILPDALAADPQFRERFDREARAISQLEHPHICALYDVGEHSGTAYLVMQHLDGETLADRLAKGALPLDQALTIAIAIASALDKAHRAGIVHRDLKPGNIMLTKAGAKLLDFGLAKSSAPVVASAGLSMLPTTPPNLTAHGTILGTFQYMAPEQLEGGDADARTDIFAFGAVLFEMLTGRKAFEGKSQASLIGAIMHAKPPPIAASLPLTPLSLDHIVGRCLAKDPDERWQAAGDVMRELQWIAADGPGMSNTIPAPQRRSTTWAGFAVAVLALLIAVGLGGWMWLRPVPQAEPIRFVVLPPNGQRFSASGPGQLSISPDGRRLAFVTQDSGGHSLWVRELGSLAARQLPGTENAWQPVWSPDSRHLAFGTIAAGDGKVKRIDVSGGRPLLLFEAQNEGSRIAWSPQGLMLFTGTDGRLYRNVESGGIPVRVTELDTARDETTHTWPIFLPDGRRFIFLARSNDQKNALYLASLDSPARTHLIDVLSSVEYTPGYLLYQREGTLMAQPFDERQGRLTGDAAPIVENVLYNPIHGRGAFSVSANGVLVYLTGTGVGSQLLTWFDATGKALGTVGAPGLYSLPRLSPDNRRVVVARMEPAARSDIWLIDLDRGVPSRFTSDPAADQAPVWSADGARVVFRSNRKGVYDLYQRASGGATADEVLFESPEAKVPTGFSPDGTLLLFNRIMGRDKKTDIWALPMTGDRMPFPVVSTAFNESLAVFSPDGRWIAYVSDDAGANHVFVEPYPSNGVKVRLSTTSGNWPAWSGDGKKVFYSTSDSHLMAVDVAIVGGDLRAGVPRDLFQWSSRGGTYFAVDPSGQRFLMSVVKEDAAATPNITVVLNWDTALKR